MKKEQEQYLLSIDQSTQGTKALIFDEQGALFYRCDKPHKQYVDEWGFVSHDLDEIYRNTLSVATRAIEESGIEKQQIVGMGISNQRETSALWERSSGKPVEKAVVWQCTRGRDICEDLEQKGVSRYIQQTTGLPLSAYYPASKISWLLDHIDGARKQAKEGKLCYGTIDTWLVYCLTEGRNYQTDYSNASRTQLLNLDTLAWDQKICDLFGIPKEYLPKITDTNGDYGVTTLGGYLQQPIPIRGVVGDSHGALFGQGCLEKGMTKTTYGTGSSVMMNIGSEPVYSENGVVTSLAWGFDGQVDYVLEGNINYTGGVIRWMKEDIGLIQSVKETEVLAREASLEDQTYLVPAFTGLSAPYWDSDARGMFYGMTRTTKRAELVKAGLESIGYQIADVVEVMGEVSQIPIGEMRVDGGPTRNSYLMKFQSDLLKIPVLVSDTEELSGMGAAYIAGLALGIYKEEEIFKGMKRSFYTPDKSWDRDKKYLGWKQAVRMVLHRDKKVMKIKN